jgi:hypothetical protein
MKYLQPHPAGESMLLNGDNIIVISEMVEPSDKLVVPCKSKDFVFSVNTADKGEAFIK